MTSDMKEMRGTDVVELVTFLESNGIDVWVDGGWGVDALLGRETRPHGDLDIAVRHKDVPRLRQILAGKGYRQVPRPDTKEWNFVLGDGKGREVDVHSFTLGPNGEPAYGIPYPAGSLTGTGTVNGRSVRCISPEHVVRFRTGYSLRETDVQDVLALCRRFGAAAWSQLHKGGGTVPCPVGIEISTAATGGESGLAWFAGVLREGEMKIWIARKAGAIIGYAVARERLRPEDTFCHPRRWCEVDQIGVHPEHRRRGVARALLDRIVGFSAASGIPRVELNTWFFNHPARQVFERLGLLPMSVRFEGKDR